AGRVAAAHVQCERNDRVVTGPTGRRASDGLREVLDTGCVRGVLDRTDDPGEVRDPGDLVRHLLYGQARIRLSGLHLVEGRDLSAERAALLLQTSQLTFGLGNLVLLGRYDEEDQKERQKDARDRRDDRSPPIAHLTNPPPAPARRWPR